MESNSNPSLKSLSPEEISKIEEFRKAKHTAILAILFSDITNSTKATEQLGEQTFSKLRHIHDELFKKIMCRDNAGIIIKEIGDSFLCVFSEPSTAVLRAIEFQRAIVSNKNNLTVDNYILSVKIGIHVGQVAVENSLALDIFGRHVNRAARIEAIANGGQVLTSQSVWENAVGWLKDNNRENIGWIAYGKTKLKGVEDKVEIFGFYPKENRKQAAPNIFKKQKRKKVQFFFVAFLFLILIFFLIFKFAFIKERTQSSIADKRKTLYVQFDFTNFGQKQRENLTILGIDSSSIKEILVAQLITVPDFDSVVTEPDLIKSFLNHGKFYVRRECNNETDEKYFRDTLKFNNILLFKAVSDSQAKPDSVMLDLTFKVWTDSSLSGQSGTYYWSANNLRNEFRNDIQDLIMSCRSPIIQATVLERNDSIVLFRISKSSKLRIGARIQFERQYSKKEGLNELLEFRKMRIEYLKDKPQFREDLMNEVRLYDKYKNDSDYFLKGNTQGIYGTYGRVIDLFDSTGRAIWIKDKKYPFENPKKGDCIYLTH
jgi:class 3 adenylate cyclase